MLVSRISLELRCRMFALPPAPPTTGLGLIH